MPHVPGAPRFDLIARRWHALAERRFAFYEELYRSGRWTLYYDSRQEFARHMLDVIKAVKIWAKLAGETPRIDDTDDFLFAA
ncbi:MAG TPA: hypothetical protein VEJ40_00115 [Pseudolabrys sp.]|nr:hypothetical protein [Pseudolabrys sp.]